MPADAPPLGTGLAFGTVLAKNYLARARVLAASLREHHPGIPIYALLTDEVEGRFDPAEEPFRVLEFSKLRPGDLELRRLAFACDRKGLAAAAKSLLLQELLARGHSMALFLDPDCQVLAPLEGLLRELEAATILLTPHRLRDPVVSAPIAELDLLCCGTFNGGVVGVRASEEAREFLRWWRERTARGCWHALEQGIYYDQRWLDLVPGFFAGARVLRAPEVNVAWWNLDERAVACRERDGELEVEGCALFHFSGFDPDRAASATGYRSSRPGCEMGAAAPLFARYARLLESHGQREVQDWPYTFDRFENGVPIQESVRVAYRALGPAALALGDPFAAPQLGEELTPEAPPSVDPERELVEPEAPVAPELAAPDLPRATAPWRSLVHRLQSVLPGSPRQPG